MKRFGSQLPVCEPHWYQGAASPYYRKSHVELRARVRKFVEERIKPNMDKWIESESGYPRELHEEAFDCGVQGVLFDQKWGGTMPEDFDAFHELILWDELARSGGGAVLGHLAINTMALPPILFYASDEIKKKVVKDVVQGRKNISLAISEPSYGSDVANIETSAVRQGDYFIVNGAKKWITGALMADFFTVAVRIGNKPGLKGLSLLLIDRNSKGIDIRKMETQASHSHHIGMVTFDDVKVPVANLIGKEGYGGKYIMINFNHERFVIAAGANRAARLCYSEAFQYSMDRKTFGKRLAQHQAIRMKLAEMARMIESTHDMLERVAYQFSTKAPDPVLGPLCALLKVQASRCFEYCAREASQIFGGSSLVKEGRGKTVERLYREVRHSAIPGGSEEILMDFFARSALRTAAKIRARL
mmetsp:Transcript_16580/g.31321  ORF Transcript_16580/g.31321 Transcript_16580/m.31321 type:complete len:417 (-) Transcript_16580:473-1723(-)